MYGPGRPLSALKQRQVSSTKTGPWTWLVVLVYADEIYDTT